MRHGQSPSRLRGEAHDLEGSAALGRGRRVGALRAGDGRLPPNGGLLHPGRDIRLIRRDGAASAAPSQPIPTQAVCVSVISAPDACCARLWPVATSAPATRMNASAISATVRAPSPFCISSLLNDLLLERGSEYVMDVQANWSVYSLRAPPLPGWSGRSARGLGRLPQLLAGVERGDRQRQGAEIAPDPAAHPRGRARPGTTRRAAFLPAFDIGPGNHRYLRECLVDVVYFGPPAAPASVGASRPRPPRGPRGGPPRSPGAAGRPGRRCGAPGPRRRGRCRWRRRREPGRLRSRPARRCCG